MKFTIVGNGCREYAIARRLQREGHHCCSFQTRPNYGLEALCAPVVVAASFDPAAIVQLAAEQRVDAMIIGSEHAVFAGVADLAQSRGILCFAPRQACSRLESDKLYAKRLVRALQPALSMPFAEVSSVDQAARFYAEHGPEVMIRPSPGAHGDALHFGRGSLSDFLALIGRLFAEHASMEIERYITGKEFSLYCLTDGQHHFFPKVVRDYPFKYRGNTGPKTGGMGSVSCAELLPDLPQRHLSSAQQCMEQVLAHLAQVEGVPFVGVLVGQFMTTDERVFFNEFDVRPGDSEIINLLESLESALAEVVLTTVTGTLSAPKLNRSSVVCMCHTPLRYPAEGPEQCFEIPQELLASDGL